MVIRPKQFSVFEQTARQAFEDEMLLHSKTFAPELCAILGDEQLRTVVHSAIARAEKYGFTNRGPIRLFIEIMFLCGSGFDTDPQYPALGEALRARDDQMQRAEKIYQGFLQYLETVSGPHAIHVQRALSDLLHFARDPLPFTGAFMPGILQAMHQIFPLKAVYVGEANLKLLINQAVQEASQYGFHGTRPQALLVVLKYAFGHGCTHDPLYPWIERTLKDERIINPSARAARLEKKAITWLEHVVADNEKRAAL